MNRPIKSNLKIEVQLTSSMSYEPIISTDAALYVSKPNK